MIARKLAPSDRAPLEKILRATGVFTEDEVGVALELMDVALGNPAQADYEFAVAAEGAGAPPLGYACWGPVPLTEGTYDLYWIAVDPARHHRGIGRFLLDYAESALRARGARLILAETSSRPAYAAPRAFYAARGYAEVSRIADFYRPGDDRVTYGKRLTL